MAQWVKDLMFPENKVQFLASLSVKDPKVWCRSQMPLKSAVSMAVLLAPAAALI